MTEQELVAMLDEKKTLVRGFLLGGTIEDYSTMSVLANRRR